MRQPTDMRTAFAWYRAAMANECPPIHPGEPQCGYFAVRAVRGGVLVPARIWLHQDLDEHDQLADDEKLLCEVNGKPADPYEVWDRLAGHPVEFRKHEEIKHTNYHAGWHQLDVPQADPSKPIDWLRVEPPVFEDA